MKDVIYSKGVPKWVSELHDYHYKRITLAGTINPNTEKYTMKVVKGIATMTDMVTVEVDGENEDAVDIETEVLRSHPEYESFDVIEVADAHR